MKRSAWMNERPSALYIGQCADCGELPVTYDGALLGELCHLCEREHTRAALRRHDEREQAATTYALAATIQYVGDLTGCPVVAEGTVRAALAPPGVGAFPPHGAGRPDGIGSVGFLPLRRAPAHRAGARACWRPIAGFGGLYEVSDRGEVRNVTSGHVKAQRSNSEGYMLVNLGAQSKGDRRTMTVHGLVSDAFLGPRREGFETRHRDGDPSNNSVENLVYGTHEENMLDQLTHGTHPSQRKVTHCPHGHEFTAANTRIRRFLGSEKRVCRTCDQAYRARRRGRGVAFAGGAL